MSISGSPFSGMPPADESSAVPLPNVSGAKSLNFRNYSVDEIEPLVKGDKPQGYLPSRYDLPKSEISLTEFVRIINRNLSRFRQGQDYADLVDHLMNKEFHFSLALSGTSLRQYRAQLIAHLSKWFPLEQRIQELLESLNNEIENHNFDLSGDKIEIDALNSAIERYNDAKNPEYRDVSLLNQALARYSSYSDARNAAVESLNTFIEDYNSKAQEYNTIIAELNIEREPFDIIPIDELPLFSSISFLPRAPLLPSSEKGVIKPIAFDSKILAQSEVRLYPRPPLFMRKLYDPVHNATIGYMDNLSYLFSMRNEYDQYDRLIGNALSNPFMDMMLLKFAYNYVDLLGEQGDIDSALRTGISWQSLDRLLARTALRGSTMETNISLTPAEIDELQLLMLNFLSKTSIQSSTGPAMNVLGSDLGRVSIGDTQISITLALTLLNRLKSALDGGVIEESIKIWVCSNKRLASFSEEERKALVGRLSSIVSLAALQNGLVQAAVALGTPGLVGQVLKIALSDLGMNKPIRAETFNDVLNNSGITVVIEARLTDDLMRHGFEEESAEQLIALAFGQALAETPFSSLADFTNNLAMQLNAVGIGSLAFSRALALRGAEYLLEMSPFATLSAHPFDYSVTMGLIDPELLLTSKALNAILEGVDKETIEPIFKKTVIELFSDVNVRTQLVSFSGDPLVEDPAIRPSPRLSREILSRLYHELKNQGVGSGDAIQVAEQFLVYLIKNKASHLAFDLTPQVLTLIQKGFQRLLKNLGIAAVEARELSIDATIASISTPEEAGNKSLIGKTERAIRRVLAGKKSMLEIAILGVLQSSGIPLHDSLSIAENVSKYTLRNRGSRNDTASFMARLARGLSFQEGLTLTPAQAMAFSGEIAHSPLKNSILAEKMGKGLDDIVGAMSSVSADEYLLAEALKEEGVSKSLAGKLASILGPHLGGMGVALQNVEEVPSDDASGKINLNATAQKLKQKALDGAFVHEQLLNAMMSSSIIKRFIEENEGERERIKQDLAAGINSALVRKMAASSESSFRNALRDEILNVTNAIDSRDIEKLSREIYVSGSVRRELLINEMVKQVTAHGDMSLTVYHGLRFAADDIFRNSDAFLSREDFNKALITTMDRYKIAPKNQLEAFVNAMRIGYVIDGGPPLFTANSPRILPQAELREQLTTILIENFKEAIPLEKARRISEMFILTLLGPVNVGNRQVEGRSIVDLIKEQIERLVKNVDSKQYRRIMMNGVLDTMSSNSNISFDAFLFTELLNANGKRFLKLIQEALLNNIGVEDKSIEKTIDLLI